MQINTSLQPTDLTGKLNQFWTLSGQKIQLIDNEYDNGKALPYLRYRGSIRPEAGRNGRRGFSLARPFYSSMPPMTSTFLNLGRQKTLAVMAPHISHIGVHDHGFNNVSTYGNLLRLMREGRIELNEWEKNFYELALKISGAVQASRWTPIKNGGFIQFLQRSALAVCRYHPFVPGAGAESRAGTCFSGRRRCENQPAGTGASTHQSHRRLFGILRRRTRLL